MNGIFSHHWCGFLGSELNITYLVICSIHSANTNSNSKRVSCQILSAQLWRPRSDQNIVPGLKNLGREVGE